MQIKTIKNEQDYEQTLARIGQLVDGNLSETENDELEVLIVLAQAWDESQSSSTIPSNEPIQQALAFDCPVKAIIASMEEKGLTNQDLIEYIGHSGRVSEILNYKRTLTLPMIRKLNKGLGIPTDVLVLAYSLKN